MGGAMTAALSCHLQNRLAAVAPIIMTTGWNLIDEFPNAKPIPIMTLTGTEDPVNFNGMDLSRNGNYNQDFDAAGVIYDFFMSRTLSE